MNHIEAQGINPTRNGIYAVEVYHGWKLLEWYDDSWWHMERVGRWTAYDHLQWIGPLPPLMGQKPEMAYDL